MPRGRGPPRTWRAGYGEARPLAQCDATRCLVDFRVQRQRAMKLLVSVFGAALAVGIVVSPLDPPPTSPCYNWPQPRRSVGREAPPSSLQPRAGEHPVSILARGGEKRKKKR